jgi:hypothetical protein
LQGCETIGPLAYRVDENLFCNASFHCSPFLR